MIYTVYECSLEIKSIFYLVLFNLLLGIFGSVNGPGFKSFGYNALQTIFYHISDYLLNENHWLNITTTCSFPQPWKKETNSSSTDEEISVDIPNIAEYTGRFGNEYLPDLNITRDVNNNRKLNANMNLISAVLHTTAENDRFLFEITEPWEIAMSFTDDNNATVKANVTFQRHNGQITSLQLKLDTTFTYMKGVSILDPVLVINGSYNHSNLKWVVLICISFALKFI